MVAASTARPAGIRRALRSAILVAAAALAPWAPAGGQDGTGAPGADEGISTRVERLREAEPWLELPDPASATRGPRTIPAGTTVTGDVTVTDGTLDVLGTIQGSATALGGDVVIHPGGSVGGDATAVLGRVRMEGGTVGGETRSVRGSLEPALAAADAPPATVGERLGLVAAWLAILVVMGVGVVFLAPRPLGGVIEALEQGFGRALLVGLAGQLALLPALLLVLVALAATIIGILLVPFAIVAFTLAAAGLMMLGFLAVARMTGGALGRGSAAGDSRGADVVALVVGTLAFVAVWALAALLSGVPLAHAALRAVAFALTWVAVTAGFGAAILSRAGTRRPAAPVSAAAPRPVEELSWQTPTPIGGVTAARRPTTSSPR